MIAQANIKNLPLRDDSIDMIFTDPPYLKEYLYTYEYLVLTAARVLKPGGFVLAMCGGAYLDKILQYFSSTDLRYYWLYANGMSGKKGGVVWRHSEAKNQPIQIRNKHILAYYKPDDSDRGSRAVSRTPTCSWYDGNGKNKIFHAWGQDVESARYYIDCFTRQGDIVLDPFIGGGTTAAACDVINRRCVSFDIDYAAAITTKYRMEQDHAYLRNLPIFNGTVT